MEFKERIVCQPAILGGKPTIKGTRIPVELVLKLLAQGATYDGILEDYPDLKLEDILAAIAYARDTVVAEEVGHLHAVGV
ncbi:MAG: hypothetical protein ACD_76C00057G0009 [uncultured bacterium]|nr:MAG: hypothetical protein ACD_76C00057G0009 [uncultured bacterium]HBD05658.1 antitoxin [Candidatus Uhrbacteria bacterium]